MSISFSTEMSESVSVYLEGQAFRGQYGAAQTGDIQVYSNIDEQAFIKLYEAWFAYSSS